MENPYVDGVGMFKGLYRAFTGMVKGMGLQASLQRCYQVFEFGVWP